MPDVTTTSPTTTSATSDTYSIRSRSSPPPTTTPCARDRSIERAGRRVAIDEQLHLRRARARHDDAADDAGRRDHRHVGREAVARALVDRHRPEVGRRAGADDLRGRRLTASCWSRSSSSCSSRAAAIGQRALLLQLRPAASASCRLQRVVLGAHVRAGRRSRSRRPRTPRHAADARALHLGERRRR